MLASLIGHRDEDKDDYDYRDGTSRSSLLPEGLAEQRLELLNLVPELLPQILFRDTLLLRIEVEKVRVQPRRTRFIIRIVISRKIRMLQTFFHCHPVPWVKRQRPLQEVDRFRRSFGEHLVEVASLAQGH